MGDLVITKVRDTRKDVYWHAHAHGCIDARNAAKYDTAESWPMSVDSKLDVVRLVYPPENFGYDIENAEHRADYENDIRFFPCTADALAEGGRA